MKLKRYLVPFISQELRDREKPLTVYMQSVHPKVHPSSLVTLVRMTLHVQKSAPMYTHSTTSLPFSNFKIKACGKKQTLLKNKQEHNVRIKHYAKITRQPKQTNKQFLSDICLDLIIKSFLDYSMATPPSVAGSKGVDPLQCLGDLMVIYMHCFRSGNGL